MKPTEVPFIDIHTHQPSICCGYSFGIHPWKVQYSNLTFLESLLEENRIAAIGETGIDRGHKDTVPLQLEVFEQHILCSEQYRKPLIIHNVHGTADILRLHKRHQPQQAWIIHGFNGTVAEAQQLTGRGIYLSVGESLLYENRKIRQSITAIPLEKLFFETDTSTKTIQEIYEEASALLNLPLHRLKEQIFANFARLNLELWNNGMTEPGCSSATMALINLDEAMC
jgi:TatD DNase family protein